jgi:hypothetical protein
MKEFGSFVLLLQCLLLLFLSPQLWAAERSREGVILTPSVGHIFHERSARRPHHRHISDARGEENDFYRYYTRKLEDNVWGSPLPEDASIPRSGLGVFMILWTSDDEAGRAKLKRCLQSLDVHFNDRFNYPVIILHQDLQQATMDAVRTWTRSRVHFVGGALLDARYEARFNETGHKMFDWSPGYLRMIRTNLYRWPLHRAFFGYRYVFKLDSDAAIVEPVNFDIFQDLALRDIKAAYFSSEVDLAYVCVNLYETVEDTLRYNQLKPMQALDRKPKYWTWYGFAFVFDTAFARSPAYLNTAWHLDNLHGAFRHRWGDPQLYLLTSMFLHENQTAQVAVPFQHQARCDHVQNLSSCQKDIDWQAAGARHQRLLSTTSMQWRWNPQDPFQWTKELWEVDPVHQAPFCSSKECSP